MPKTSAAIGNDVLAALIDTYKESTREDWSGRMALDILAVRLTKLEILPRPHLDAYVAITGK